MDYETFDDKDGIPEYREENNEYFDYVINSMWQEDGISIFEEIDKHLILMNAASINHDFEEMDKYRDRLAFLKWQTLYITHHDN